MTALRWDFIVSASSRDGVQLGRIVVLERGQIVEEGTHAELLRREMGHYTRLHRLQQG